MGISGLSSFVKINNETLIEKNFKLKDTKLVIDASNLKGTLGTRIDEQNKGFTFGCDSVKLGDELELFVNNLKSCNVEPIFVLDGTQTIDINTSKTRVKLSRKQKQNENVNNVSSTGLGEYIPNTIASIVLKSKLLDLNVEVVQAFYDADLEVARLARKYDCPLVSDDGDFFIIDMPRGVISIKSLQYADVKSESIDGITHKYISCELYLLDNLICMFPNLDKQALLLLGPLVGNDFVEYDVFKSFCYSLTVRQNCFLLAISKSHHRIIRVLSFLNDKSLDEAIGCISSICSNIEVMKYLLFEQVKVYQIDYNCNFIDDMSKYIKSKLGDNALVSSKRIVETCEWLKKTFEQECIYHICLDIITRSKIFFGPTISDPSCQSPITCCLSRVVGILGNFMRLSDELNEPIEYYDRVGRSYLPVIQEPIRLTIDDVEYDSDEVRIENLKLFDLPFVKEKFKSKIVHKTFYSDEKSYNKYLGYINDMNILSPMCARGVTTLQMLFKYIEKVSNFKLWLQFKQSILITYIFHLSNNKIQGDTKSASELTDVLLNSGIDKKLIQVDKFNKFDIEIVHQISLMQISLLAFHSINGLFGSKIGSLKPDTWFNGLYIYNLTQLLKDKEFSFPETYKFLEDDEYNHLVSA